MCATQPPPPDTRVQLTWRKIKASPVASSEPKIIERGEDPEGERPDPEVKLEPLSVPEVEARKEPVLLFRLCPLPRRPRGELLPVGEGKHHPR